MRNDVEKVIKNQIDMRESKDVSENSARADSVLVYLKDKKIINNGSEMTMATSAIR